MTSQHELFTPGLLNSVKDVTRFMLAGNATITIRSKKTSVRYTYKVVQKENADAWFVRILTGADNEQDFTYLGFMYYGKLYLGSRRSLELKPKGMTSGLVAFEWLLKIINYDDLMPTKAAAMLDSIEVWHEGRCGRCNRKLTVPESIASGFGPECINYVN